MVSNATLDQHLKNLAGEEVFQQVLEFQQKCVSEVYGEREWFFRDGFLLGDSTILLAFRALKSEDHASGPSTYFLGAGNLERQSFILENSFEAKEGTNGKPIGILSARSSKFFRKQYFYIASKSESNIKEIIGKIPCYVLPRKKEVLEAYFGQEVNLFHAKKPSLRLKSDSDLLRKEGFFECQEKAYANSMDGVIVGSFLNVTSGKLELDGHYSFFRKQN
ncbi:hypothetical protein H8D91_01575 [archaeon]|nr:hypothetical protein [archaeon]